MSLPGAPYSIFPLGDSALSIDFGNVIDESINQLVIARFHQLQRAPLPFILESVPAYSSLSIFYDAVEIKKISHPKKSAFEWMKEKTEDWLRLPVQAGEGQGRLIKIPVCYKTEFAPDINKVVAQKAISIEELIQIHTAKQYRVYMLGFLPGFAYMGELDERIKMTRKPQPVLIAAGSVGIAGKQTGIYPLDSPGGWQIIGRTPLQLFTSGNDQPTLLQAGDTVQFNVISKNDFYSIKGAPSH